MRLIFRVFLVLVGVVALLLVGAYLYLSPDRVKAWMTPRLESALNRKVTLTDAHVDWFGPGVVISGLRVQDRAGFGPAPFLAADGARVALPLWPLLTGQAQLGELALEQPAVSVVVNAQGEVNAGDLLKGQGARLLLPVDRVRLTRGTVRYDNRQAGRVAVLQNVAGHVQGARADGGVALSGAFAIEACALVPASGRASQMGAVDLAFHMVWGRGVLAVDSLTVGVGPFAVTLSGQVRGIPAAPVADLRAVNQAVDFDRVRRFLIDRGALSEQASMQGSGHLTLTVSGAWPFAVHGEVTADGIEISDPRTLGAPVANGQVRAVVDGNRVRVHAVQARAGVSDVSLSGVIAPVWPGRSQVSFALVSHMIDADALRPKAAFAAAWGWATPVFAAEGGSRSVLLALLDAADLDGSARVDTLIWNGMKGQNLEATVHAANGALHVSPLTGQVHDGALKVEGLLTSRPEGADIDASVSLVNAQAEDLLRKSLKWAVPLKGRVKVTARVQGAVDTSLAWAVPTVQIDGTARMDEGRLVKWDLLQQASKDIAQLGLLTADEVPLRDVTVAFSVRGRTVRLDGTQLKAADMACRVSGIGEVNGALNYALDVDVPSERVNVGGFNLGRALGALFGHTPTIPVRVNISGTTARPEVTAGMR